MLEIAAGSGQHAAFFAAHLPSLRSWQPSDADPDALASIAAWTEGVKSVLPPLLLDVTADDWPIASVDAIVCINLIHIAPVAACEALMRGAGRLLPVGGVLYLYGPYRVAGEHTAPSNAAFDRSLQERDPAWGVRDLDEVTRTAEAAGLRRAEVIPMPGNNLSVVFHRE